MAAKETKTQAETPLEKAYAKAAELTEKFKIAGVFKVHPIVFDDEVSGDIIIGYFKEPSRAAKLAVMDKSMLGAYGAIEEILPSIIIREESDPRIYSEDQANDSIFMGVLMAVYSVIKFKPNTAKKK